MKCEAIGECLDKAFLGEGLSPNPKEVYLGTYRTSFHKN